MYIYMYPWNFVVQVDSSFRCNNLCVRRHRNTFPYQHIISLPNSNISVSIASTGERGQRAMLMFHPVANNCLSKPFEPQWKQLLHPNNPANAQTRKDLSSVAAAFKCKFYQLKNWWKNFHAYFSHQPISM